MNSAEHAMEAAFTAGEIKGIVRNVFDAFVETGKYALSYRQACEQFGKTQIDTLIANGLLENESSLMGKKKFVISDIISAQAAFRKM